MIITRTPLRISFVGGGSDRPSFYNEEPGACVAAAIDKYVYVAVNGKYDGSIRAAYSITENVATVDQLQHELIREILQSNEIDQGIEIHSIADIPGGTGLGSSSSFVVGLLKALRPGGTSEGHAERACDIEITRCHKPIGKQDQYTASYGGLNLLGFAAQGVTVTPITCDLEALSAHCLLLDTGLLRTKDAGAVLASQQQDHCDVGQLAYMAKYFARALTEGSYQLCGTIMDTAWMIKRRFVGDSVDAWYAAARIEGAWGGKLCGAGGGGFLLFMAPPEKHKRIVKALNLRQVRVQLGVEGSKVIYSD